MPKRAKRSSDEMEEADDDIPSPISRKRQKLDEDMDDIMDQIENALANAQALLEGINKDSRPSTLVKAFVLDTLKKLSNFPGEKEAHDRIELVQEYIQDYIQRHLSTITVATQRRPIEHSLMQVVEYLPEFKLALYKRAPPSTFAIAKEWPAQQKRPGAMLCLRPVDKRGLPIYLLHRVFLVFRIQRRQPLPDIPKAAEAMRTAIILCSIMGNAFPTEDARSLAFSNAVKEFFRDWLSQGKLNITDGTVSGQVDRALRSRGPKEMILALGEDKLEFETGDPYMQVSRSYDLKSAQDRQENSENVSRGAPAFLMTLAGPDLMICGGFIDGRHTIVEPLSDKLQMLPDFDASEGRVVNLARHLFALRSCLLMLEDDDSKPGEIGCPRIFTEFRAAKSDEGEHHPIKFLRHLPELSHPDVPFHTLFFRVQVTIRNKLCVAHAKVPAAGYGIETHLLLSNENMAPELYGVSRVETAQLIIMQSLDEWHELSYYCGENKPGLSAPSKAKLLERLERILDTLESNGMVHGDLRMENVMLKAGEEEKAVLIDFDWAGKVGDARYPHSRSNAVFYSGKAGGPIGAKDDRELFDSWKHSL